ncbi:helix-turn-helix transcriptional regulator [Robiginitalea sp. IMCC44478]|uniref:helix-turn-helix transcriptional regulator n=1 Tax=Robiginitalea sp. IMCC44478 TaxID=3459122 RepID=UPI0040414F0A
MEKNIAGGSLFEIEIEESFLFLQARNESAEKAIFKRDIDRRFVQFHFCIKGTGQFHFNDNRYSLEVPQDQSLLLYNPQADLPLQLELMPNSEVLSLLMTIRKFHGLFTSEAGYIPFLSEEYRDKKYYQQEPINPSISLVLSQLSNQHMHPSVSKLYCKAKAYELLSLFFNRNADNLPAQCPFLVDEENLSKIRKAKDIIIEHMAEPPGLGELARQVGLSLKKLKEGFKQVYGDSVFSFLFDYKMEFARKLLESGKYNVNEVGLKIGYSTASHFIAAFKKKYHTTPKKYLMSLAQQGA